MNGWEDLSLALAAMLLSYRRLRPVTTVILRLDTPTIGRSTRYLHAAITFLIRPWIHADLHGSLGSRTAGSPSRLEVGLRQRI